ncbi:interleukin-1 receptor type 1 isoform X2 [Melanotaenia boesemani]|uniref:interleukin-1 receptor type 1 isoform X2 n=1 Tax=Melanotaenia boesemani TaxID=1250792 RepID=UPI001C05E105|nr:interleukin-1 receptor type 1 isoform X2 [Melanotaenia boesemani]
MKSRRTEMSEQGRRMAALGCVCLLASLLSLALAVEHMPHAGHSGETDTYYVSAGHLFLLKCRHAEAHVKVTWSRGDSDNASLPDGVEVRDGLLWFLPVQMSHCGIYTCEKRDETGTLWRRFRVSVSRRECPDPPENIITTKGLNVGLPCKQTEIFSLNATKSVRWMKDCHSMQHEDEPSVDKQGLIRLSSVSEGDAGKYTCLIDISVDGRTYTTARSIQLTVNNDLPEVFPELQVVSPQQDEIIVQVVYVGFSEDPEIYMFWTLNRNFIEDYKEFNQTWKFIHDRGKVYGLSTLTISKVLPDFLNVPIYCHVISPAEEKVGMALLKEADHSAFYMSLTLCLAASVALLVLAATFFFFRVELILVYRKLTAHVLKQEDGKFYDAYVNFLQPDTLSLEGAARFALEILPTELEQKHGYSLYIGGRDDCPGEAMHDAFATTIRQCRRLIIILSPDGKTKEMSPLCEKQQWYEQKVGLHDALMHNDPKVILVEVDGPVDYSHLPESLHYIKRKQGALRWKKAFGSRKPTKFYSNRNFWKNLRYHMPPVSAKHCQTIV